MNRIIPGTFCGAEIDPGTFHASLVFPEGIDAGPPLRRTGPKRGPSADSNAVGSVTYPPDRHDDAARTVGIGDRIQDSENSNPSLN